MAFTTENEYREETHKFLQAETRRGYWTTFYHSWASLFGLTDALTLSYLANTQRNFADDSGFITLRRDLFQKRLGLSKGEADDSLQRLMDWGVILAETKDHPLFIDIQKIEQLLRGDE